MLRLRQFGGLTLTGPDGVLAGVAAHRRALALLTVLASGREHGVSRAKVASLLWTDSDEAHARGALSQTVYRVRQELGADVLLGADQLRLNPAIITAEAAELEELLDVGELHRAVALYAGPFLDGFNLPRAPQFERWAGEERFRLAQRYGEALVRLGERAGGRGAHAEAATWWRMLATADPLSSRAAAQLVQALAASGDVSGALRAARVHETLVRAELGTDPDATFLAAVAKVRAVVQPAQVPASPSVHQSTHEPHEPDAARPDPGAAPSPRVGQGSEAATTAVSAPATALERVRSLLRRSHVGRVGRALGWLALGGAAAAGAALMFGRGAPSASGALELRQWGTLQAADVVTSSPVARGIYETGLRAFNRGETAVAARLFEAALDEDSTFAMAAYYAYRAYRSTVPAIDRAIPYLERARRLAQRTNDRERLIVEATWADVTEDPRRLALAESLTVRHPGDAMAHLLLGNALHWDGNFADAVVAYREGVRLDPIGLRDGVAECIACEAMRGMIDTYLYADSLAAAARLAREWSVRQPSSAPAWSTLASVLALQNDTSGAANALRRSLALESAPEWQFFAAALAIRAGDFRRADRLLDGISQTGAAALRADALWWITIARRYQERFGEALDSALALRALAPDDPAARQLHAQVLVELGRAREAADLLDTLARDVRGMPAISEATSARRLVWTLTHHATALAEAGDTSSLAAIAEELRLAGERSGYGRDRRLHHYVRGLLLAARQRPSEAITELRQAIFSPAAGYTRINVALAKLYLERGEPREAIPLLRAALNGPLEASNLYVTHTELRALLAHAFAALAEPDSAAAHWLYVQRARASAAPMLNFTSR